MRDFQATSGTPNFLFWDIMPDAMAHDFLSGDPDPANVSRCLGKALGKSPKGFQIPISTQTRCEFQ